MIKRRLFVVIAVIFCLVLLMPSCNVEKQVPISYCKDYNSEVLENGSVEGVSVTFSRPSLTIEVKVSDSISDDEIVKILESTKSFVTVDNMNAIAKRVKWNLAISSVYLDIRSINDKTQNSDNLLGRYESFYLKTSNAMDHSPENIDGYKTWIER